MPEKKKKKEEGILKPKVKTQLEKEYKTATGKDFDYNKGRNVKVSGEILDPFSVEAQERALRSAVSRSKVPPIEGAQETIRRDPETGEVISTGSLNAQKLAQQVGQQPEVTPEQQEGLPLPLEQIEAMPLGPERTKAYNDYVAWNSKRLDFGQAFASASAGAAGGAVAGSFIPGVGNVLGAIGGFLTGFIANLRSQASGRIEAASQNVEKVETNIRALITDTNMNPGNAARNTQLFNAQLNRLDSAYAQLRMETRSNLNKFLDKDGTPQLERFEIFNSPGGARQILTSQMQTAVLNPNPNINLITVDELNQNI